MLNHLPKKYYYLIILALCGFLTSFAFQIVNTNLAVYGKLIGAGTFILGLIMGVYGFAELIMKPVAGFLGDRVGMRVTLQIGILVFISATLVYFLLNPKLLILVRFLQGIGASAFSTLSLALVAKFFMKNRGTAYGIYNTVKGIGYGLAPLTGGLIVAKVGFSALFVLISILGIFVLFLTLFLPGDHQGADMLTFGSFKSFLKPFQDKNSYPVYAAIIINTFSVGALFGFLPLYLYSIGYTPVEYGIVVSIAAVSYVGIQPIAGYLADRVRVHLTILVGLLLTGVGISIATFTSGYLLVFCIMLAAIGAGMVWTNSDLLISKMVSRDHLGAGLGAAQFFKEFGDLGGPLFIGAMSQIFGIRYGFMLTGIMALVFHFILCRTGDFRKAMEEVF